MNNHMPVSTNLILESPLSTYNQISAKDRKPHPKDILREDGTLQLGCIGEIKAGEEIKFRLNLIEVVQGVKCYKVTTVSDNKIHLVSANELAPYIQPA